jgi:hypothetical protein
MGDFHFCSETIRHSRLCDDDIWQLKVIETFIYNWHEASCWTVFRDHVFSVHWNQLCTYVKW